MSALRHLDPRTWTRFTIALLLIALAGLGIRLAVITFEAPTTARGDSIFYNMTADLMADGHGYLDPIRFRYPVSEEVPQPDGTVRTISTQPGTEFATAQHPPAFTFYLSLFSRLGLRSFRAHQIATALLGTLSIILAGLLGRSMGGPRSGTRVGLIAAALTAVYANIYVSDVLVMSESIAIAFVFLTSLVGLRFWRSPTVLNAALFGIVGAGAALSRVELVVFLPVIAVVGVLRSPLQWRQRLGRVAVVGVASLLLIGPWLLRNNLAMHRRISITASAGVVLVQANCDATYYGHDLGWWNMACGDPWPYGADGTLLDESERDAAVGARGRAYMADHMGRLVTVVVPARVGRMWGLFQPLNQIHNEILEGRPTFSAWLGFWEFVVLAPLAIGGAEVQWRRRQPVLVVGFWAILVTFTAAAAFGNVRYRTAAEIPIVIFAAIALDAIIGRVRPGDAMTPEARTEGEPSAISAS